MVILKTPQFPFEKKQNAPSLAHSTVIFGSATVITALLCYFPNYQKNITSGPGYWDYSI